MLMESSIWDTLRSINMWRLLWGISAIFVIIIASMRCFYSQAFTVYKERIRVIWFGVTLFLGFFLACLHGYNEKNWKELSLMVAVLIITDIMIIHTPKVLKIFGVDMVDSTEVVKSQKKMENDLETAKIRTSSTLEYLDLVVKEDFNTQAWYNVNDYISSLKEFLGYFLSHHYKGFNMDINIIEATGNTEEDRRSCGCLGFLLEKDEMEAVFEKAQWEKEGQVVLYSNTHAPILFLIKAKQEDLLQVDYSNILLVTLVHSWYAKGERNRFVEEASANGAFEKETFTKEIFEKDEEEKGL
ncbi:MAG: type II toxin-antitoxin system SpoIISA family toxin [Bacillaceae bacterium]